MIRPVVAAHPRTAAEPAEAAGACRRAAADRGDVVEGWEQAPAPGYGSP
jgi:hypothetical protein